MIIAVDGRPLMTRQIGGAEQHARSIITQWAAMNVPHQFLVLCDRSHRDPQRFDQSFVDALPAQFQQIFIRSFGLFPRWQFGSRLLTSLSWTLARSKANVFHSFTPRVPQIPTCPVVQTVHDLACELDPDVRQKPDSRRLRRLLRTGTRQASHIIAVSSQTKNDIEALYGIPSEHIYVVYNGINPAFTPAPNPTVRATLQQRFHFTGPYILAVGSDIPRRNYARMLEAMTIFWQAEPDVQLMVAGRCQWPASPLFRRAKAAGVAERIVWVDGPSDTELAQLYRGALLTCCASSFEGFGLSVLESMACGTPVTCSDMRSLREVAADAAVYFPHDDPPAMAESLLGLIEDIEYRRQLKYRGLGRAGLFTWRTAAEMILAVLTAVAAHATPAPQADPGAGGAREGSRV